MSPDNLLQQRSRRAITEIVEAARGRFGRLGYAATTIDDVAADSGRTKGAVYHHFDDKRDLFGQVFVAEQRRIADTIAGRTTAAAPLDALTEGLATYLSIIARSPTSATITLIDGPAILGWQEWRSCGDGPFRSMLRAALAAIDADADARDRRLSARYELDLLTEILLGAVTEAAYNTLADPHPRRAARRYAEQLGRLAHDLAT